jgi:hypothetical protein
LYKGFNLIKTVAVVLETAAVQHKLNVTIGCASTSMRASHHDGELLGVVRLAENGALGCREVVAGDGLVAHNVIYALLWEFSQRAASMRRGGRGAVRNAKHDFETK